MSTEAQEDHYAIKFLRNAESLLMAVTLAGIMWLSDTTYDNSLVLERVSTQMTQVGVDLNRAQIQNKEAILRLSLELARVTKTNTMMAERVTRLEALRIKGD